MSDPVEHRLAFYARAVAEAAAALAVPDRDLDAERRTIQQAQEAGL